VLYFNNYFIFICFKMNFDETKVPHVIKFSSLFFSFYLPLSLSFSLGGAYSVYGSALKIQVIHTFKGIIFHLQLSGFFYFALCFFFIYFVYVLVGKISLLSSLVCDEMCGHEHFELAVHEPKDLAFFLLASEFCFEFVLCVVKWVCYHSLPRKIIG